MAKASGKAGSVVFSPHIHSRASIEKIMWDVVIALIPAGLASVYFFGLNAILIITTSLITGLFTELIISLLTGKGVTILDGSAVITSLLFAYNLPPASPWYVTVTGCFFAIAIVKLAFGGLGYNFINPALGGRVFAMVVWPSVMMGKWSPAIQNSFNSLKITGLDAVSTASPLSTLKMGGWDAVRQAGFDNYWNLFIGNRPGCIGETSALAILAGLAYLLVKKVVLPTVPVIYIGTTALLAWIFGGLPLGTGFFTGNAAYHILSGGLILGACFMATDYVTSPLSVRGKVIYAFFLGVLTMAIRLYIGYPEGAGYAIVFMNLLVPLIDKYAKERIYGYGKAGDN